MVTTKYGVITFSCSCELIKVKFKHSISPPASERTVRALILNNQCGIYFFTYLQILPSILPVLRAWDIHCISTIRSTYQTSIYAQLLNAPHPKKNMVEKQFSQSYICYIIK